MALVSFGLPTLLVPLVEAPTHGWQLWNFLALTAAMILLDGFCSHQEGRRKVGHQPLVKITLMCQSRFAQGELLALLIYSSASSVFLCFAFLVQTGFGLSPFEAGSVFVPCSIIFVIFSLRALRLVARFGTPIIAAGTLACAVSFAVIVAQVRAAGADPVVTHLIPVLIVIGEAQAMIITPLLNLVFGLVEQRQAGMASSGSPSCNRLGQRLAWRRSASSSACRSVREAKGTARFTPRPSLRT